MDIGPDRSAKNLLRTSIPRKAKLAHGASFYQVIKDLTPPVRIIEYWRAPDRRVS